MNKNEFAMKNVGNLPKVVDAMVCQIPAPDRSGDLRYNLIESA